ncbi:MAG: HAMP domain-containing protein [Gammaproteobacteria bacterium]|nr:HAMP domain-containing protein [Gammaproteobacteria bacterium]
MNKTLRNTASFLAISTLLLVSLYLISDATSNSATFGKYYIWLISFNAVGLVLLLALIIYNVYRLIVQYRLKTIGSHLTARMIGVFVLLTIIPVSIVYYFSLSFLHRSIDSWFDVGIETALEDSLQLGRRALDLRKREALNKTRDIALEISELDDTVLVVYLDQAREQHNATELTLVDHNQSILASSSIDSTALPTALALTDVGELDTNNHYLKLVEDQVYGLAIRIAVLVQSSDATEKDKTLQALYPFTDRLNALTVGVQAAFDQYKELAVLRNPLKTSFTLALSLIWLLSVLTAIWLAFVAARKLVAPINDLVEGTKAVAAGDYEKQLAVSGTDELGFLLRSFNTMTRKISRSRAIAEQSQLKEAMQKDYLESVMAHINSGVLTIDETGFIKSGNPAACSIFDIDSYYFSELYISDVVRQYPKMRSFFEAVVGHTQSADEWQEEVIIFGQSGRKILRLRGTALQSQADERREQVIVVDDVTQLIQAQKDSAWSEMARRLAHEIKNPLTPIQLSAERLQRKLGGEVPPEKQAMLDRYTHTIVQQVEAMKSMVNAFTDYARSSAQKPEELDFNQMLEAISVLYHENHTEVSLQLDLEKELPPILADGVRLRQLVHNLIKNSLEAIEERGWIKLQTRSHREQGRYFVAFVVEDSGDGIADKIVENLFEPYVTTKTAGSGLGLAIVQKIVDEHGGVVWVEKSHGGGARFIVRLPLLLLDSGGGKSDETIETESIVANARVIQ